MEYVNYEPISRLLDQFKSQLDMQLDTITQVVNGSQTKCSTLKSNSNPVSAPSSSNDGSGKIYQQVYPKRPNPNGNKCTVLQNSTEVNTFQISESRSTVKNSTPARDSFSNGFEQVKSTNVPFNGINISISPVAKRDTTQSDHPRYIDVPFHEYITVHPSFIYSSRNFYVHLNYDEVAQFNIKLNERYSDRSLNVPLSLFQIKMKMLCCIYNEVEGNYLRAQIIHKQGMAKYCVLLVDFGELLIVAGKVIYPLDPRFASVPIFAVSCYLDGHWNKDSKFLENFLQHFFTLITEMEIELKAKFCPPRCGGKHPVSLMARTSDEPWQDVRAFAINKFANLALCDRVKTCLFKFNDLYKIPSLEYTEAVFNAYNQFQKTSHNKTVLPLNCGYRATASYIHGVLNFISVISSMPLNQTGEMYDPENFTTNLTYFYLNSVMNNQQSITNESIVAFKLGPFYFRGFVLNTCSNNIEILSLDFGFIGKIPSAEIVLLSDMFSLEKYPMLSIVCSLADIEGTNIKAASAVFKDMFKGVEFDLKTNAITKNRHEVTVLLDGVKINDALKHL